MSDTRSEFERAVDEAVGKDVPSNAFRRIERDIFRAGFLAALKLLGDLPTERTKSLREQAERVG